MTDYVLDMNKWRCGKYDGGPGANTLGVGKTRMLNKEGFMCCLGQFAQQQGVPDEALFNKQSPEDLYYIYDPNFIKERKTDKGTHLFVDTKLVNTLMGVNDDPNTTIRRKVKMIRELLEKHGHTLKVIPLENSGN